MHQLVVLCCHSGEPQEMKKWGGRGSQQAKRSAKICPLGGVMGSMDHTGEQPAGRTFAEEDLRVLGTPS